jgi:hypothetical protein
MNFITKKCRKCGQTRKFLVDSERDKYDICGECWNWDDPKQNL